MKIGANGSLNITRGNYFSIYNGCICVQHNLRESLANIPAALRRRQSPRTDIRAGRSWPVPFIQHLALAPRCFLIPPIERPDISQAFHTGPDLAGMPAMAFRVSTIR